MVSLTQVSILHYYTAYELVVGTMNTVVDAVVAHAAAVRALCGTGTRTVL